MSASHPVVAGLLTLQPRTTTIPRSYALLPISPTPSAHPRTICVVQNAVRPALSCWKSAGDGDEQRLCGSLVERGVYAAGRDGECRPRCLVSSSSFSRYLSIHPMSPRHHVPRRHRRRRPRKRERKRKEEEKRKEAVLFFAWAAALRQRKKKV